MTPTSERRSSKIINHGNKSWWVRILEPPDIFFYKMPSSGDWILGFYRRIWLKSNSAQSANSAH